MKELERLQNFKITIYNVSFKKILLYGEETLACTKRKESKLQAAKTTFLRGLVGKTRRESISLRWRKYRTKLREVD
jgi:hypothetical protein